MLTTTWPALDSESSYTLAIACLRAALVERGEVERRGGEPASVAEVLMGEGRDD